jgi:hypothetical protein
MGGRESPSVGLKAEEKTKMIGSAFHCTSAGRPVAIPTESKILRRIL